MRIRYLIALFFCCLLVTSCSFVQVQNLSEINARVLIQTPDGGSYTKKIESGRVEETFSSHGGSYTVAILADQEYIALLRELRDAITFRLFEEGATLTTDEVSQLVARLDDIENAVEEARDNRASCSGTLPDFETAISSISTGEGGRFTVSCSSGSQE
jgi:hypothetical protein